MKISSFHCPVKITGVLALFLFLISMLKGNAQATDCKLRIGTNLGGISDWMTEMPFVDMMHNARTWGTRNATAWIEGGDNEWNTELQDSVEKDENGYPLEVPFYINNIGLEDSQIVFTVWAVIEAWEPGVYTCLYDGEGEIEFGADGEIISSLPGKLRVNVSPSPGGGFLEMKIKRSIRGNHIRNIRFIMPGHEETYARQPFNPLYLERLKPFKALRFMDWGSTNNWGHDYMWLCDDEAADTIRTPWHERSQLGYYTWATNKGVPYEMMCDLCNTLGVDMWICTPHCASDEYISEMASLVKNRLNPDLHVYSEYGNENWNWMFGQTQWLNTFFCEGRGISWPEGIVDKVQNHLNLWTKAFVSSPERLTRVVGVQTAWQDVANRTIRNLNPESFDAVAITGYFRLSEEGDTYLDEKGPDATVADVARWVRKEMKENEVEWIKSDYEELGIPLNKKIVYYEAGQHITPTPFGEEPSYAQALLDIQRDTALYNMYKEWFTHVENLIPEGEEALYMNFSFIGSLSAQYGSWGILETLNQDTSVIYAPKHQALMEQIEKCGTVTSSSTRMPLVIAPDKIKIIRRSEKQYVVFAEKPISDLLVYDLSGRLLIQKRNNNSDHIDFNFNSFSAGSYIITTVADGCRFSKKIVVD